MEFNRSPYPIIQEGSNLGLKDRVGLLDVPEHLHDGLLEVALTDLLVEEMIGHDGQLAHLPHDVLLVRVYFARQDFRTGRLGTPVEDRPKLLQVILRLAE